MLVLASLCFPFFLLIFQHHTGSDMCLDADLPCLDNCIFTIFTGHFWIRQCKPADLSNWRCCYCSLEAQYFYFYFYMYILLLIYGLLFLVCALSPNHLQILPCNSFHTKLFPATILGDLEKLGQGQIDRQNFQLVISQ